MATPYDLLRTENEQLKQQLANKEQQLIIAKQVHDQYRVEKQEKEDLLFALLHSLGPRIDIRITNFREFLKDAQYGGTLAISDTGHFEAHLFFCEEGFEQHFRQKLILGSTEETYKHRLSDYESNLKLEATPEEAYTIALYNNP